MRFVDVLGVIFLVFGAVAVAGLVGALDEIHDQLREINRSIKEGIAKR